MNAPTVEVKDIETKPIDGQMVDAQELLDKLVKEGVLQPTEGQVYQEVTEEEGRPETVTTH